MFQRKNRSYYKNNSEIIGGYGEVKVCKQKDNGEERAVKIINKAKMTDK